MGTSVQKFDGNALVKDGDWEVPGLTVQALKDAYAPGANDQEFLLYLQQVQAFHLDPRKRECYFVKYGGKAAQVIVGYHSYLKQAQLSGKLNGWGVALSYDKNIATITIHRNDWANPFVWSVNRKEFDTGKSTWLNMPDFMLQKVAIAQGFRMCFPEVLGGMPYVLEEISKLVDNKDMNQIAADQAGNSEPVKAPVKGKAKPAPKKDKPVAPAEKVATPPKKEKVDEAATPEVLPPTAVSSGESGEPVIPEDALQPEQTAGIITHMGSFEIDEAAICSALGIPDARYWQPKHTEWLREWYVAMTEAKNAEDLDEVRALKYSE